MPTLLHSPFVVIDDMIACVGHAIMLRLLLPDPDAVVALWQIEEDALGHTFGSYKTRYPAPGTAAQPLASGKVGRNAFLDGHA